MKTNTFLCTKVLRTHFCCIRNYILENNDLMFYYLQTKYVEWKKMIVNPMQLAPGKLMVIENIVIKIVLCSAGKYE